MANNYSSLDISVDSELDQSLLKDSYIGNIDFSPSPVILPFISKQLRMKPLDQPCEGLSREIVLTRVILRVVDRDSLISVVDYILILCPGC